MHACHLDIFGLTWVKSRNMEFVCHSAVLKQTPRPYLLMRGKQALIGQRQRVCVCA